MIPAETPAVDLDAIRAINKLAHPDSVHREHVSALLGMVDTLTAQADEKARQASDAMLVNYELQHQVRTLTAIVASLAAHDPRPTTDDAYCYFCGESSAGPEAPIIHADHCLWVAATAALAGTSPTPPGSFDNHASETAADTAAEGKFTESPTPPDVMVSGETLKSPAEISTPARDLAALADQWWAESNKLVESGTRVVTITYAGALRDCARELRAALGVSRSAGHEEESDLVVSLTPTDTRRFRMVEIADESAGGAPTTEPERCAECGGTGWDEEHRHPVRRGESIVVREVDHLYCPKHGDLGFAFAHGRCQACWLDPDTTGGGA